MNTEFQWRSQMRQLGGSVEPTRELWPNIAARIAIRSTLQNRLQVAFAIAATLVIAFAAGFIAKHGNWQTSSAESRVAATAPTAMDWAQPHDVKLAAAARDLDEASAQLQQALEQHPDAVFLVGLLNRANGQRMRLLRQQSYTGA